MSSHPVPPSWVYDVIQNIDMESTHNLPNPEGS